jgi:hypothetical protein
MSTRKSARKRSFDHESRNEAMQRRLAGFEGLIMRAAHGDPEPLCAYLRDGDPPITEEDARLLAWLLERKLPRRRGRPIKKGLEIVPVSRMDEVLARAMTRKPEPIEWDETTTTAAATSEATPVEEEASTLTAH